jgi:tRNA-dihydrouridine synthase A
MIGREAYHRPWLLAEIWQRIDGSCVSSREQLLARMACYAREQLAQGARLAGITRHMLGLYTGEPGAREYRRMLSEGARAAGAGVELLLSAVPAGRTRASAQDGAAAQ